MAAMLAGGMGCIPVAMAQNLPAEGAAATQAADKPPASGPSGADSPRKPDELFQSIDAAIAGKRYAEALERIYAAEQAAPSSAALRFRAAQALYGLGQGVGTLEVREFDGGRPGQFAGQWLLLERRGPRKFLCCPEDSALYQLRRALDAGFDEPAAHLLHARLWYDLGRPQIGYSIVKSRAAKLLDKPDRAVLSTFAELALAADALDDYLRYACALARLDGERRAETLAAAYRTVADRYALRGDAVLYREFLCRALRQRPDDVAIMSPLAEAEWDAGRAEQAIQLYRRILASNPDHPARETMLKRIAAQAGPTATAPAKSPE